MVDNKIIEMAKGGDADAFCQLYDQYKDRLYRYAVYRLENTADAEDAVSDCVLSAWKQIRNLRDAQAFPAWIFRILSAVCTRKIAAQIEERKNRQNPALWSEASGTAGTHGTTGTYGTERRPEEQIADPSDIRRDGDPELSVIRLDLIRALNLLTEEERDIVLLSVVAGFTSKEIAQIRGSRPGTIRSKQSRSLAKMRQYLEERDVQA